MNVFSKKKNVLHTKITDIYILGKLSSKHYIVSVLKYTEFKLLM